MSRFVVLADGSSDDDLYVAEAVARAGPDGAVVLIAVLPGSLVAGVDPPRERGRRRRELEDEAVRLLRDQLVRIGATCEAAVVALFGDPVDDTLLLANNLGADAVVVRSDAPSLGRLRSESMTPVVAVPQAEAPA